MSARACLNLGLVVLLAGLALVIWLRPGQQSPEEAHLTALDPVAITRITIRRAGHRAIVIERRNGQWWLSSPAKMPANDVRVNSLLNLALKTSDTKYKANELNLARYGLAEPQVVVTLNDQEVAFGNINPVSYRRYVLVEDTVYLISDDLYELETADAATYVTPRLLPQGVDITALKLPQVTLEQKEGGSWRQEPPRVLTETEIEALLIAWRDAQALRVAAYEEQPSQAQANVELGNSRELLFEVTAREPDLILARPDLGIQYHLPADAASSLLHPESNAAPKS